MKVKKIAALAVGAAMVGATVGFASAQPTVPNIPKDFFVKDGQPNVKIVVGSQGAAQDVASAADIAVALGTLLYTQEDVKVKDASVVVKKDVTEPVVDEDPADIPIFFNEWYTYGDKSKPYAWTSDEKMGAVAGWWNGADPNAASAEIEDWKLSKPGHIVDDSSFTTYDKSFLKNGVINDTVTKNLDGDDPLDFTIGDFGYVKFENPVVDKKKGLSFDEGNVIDYNVKIGQIELDGLSKLENITNPDDMTSKVTLVIPKETVKVSMTFAISEYSHITDKMCNCTEYYLDDGVKNPLRPGVTKGDTIQLFDKNFTIVGVNETLKDFGGPYGLIIGTPYKPVYINVGEAQPFGDYTVEVVDIDIKSDKALLEVTDTKTGESRMITLKTGDYDVLFDGGIYVKLDSVFVGIGGHTTAQVEVATDLVGLNKGDEILPGWEIDRLDTVVKNNVTYLQNLTITNSKDLKGSQINLFNTYEVAYKTDYKTFYCKKSDTKFYVAKAWIDFDPLTKTKEETKELAKGDKLEGWTIDDIKVTTDPAKADVVTKITKPITVLDTEVLKAGLDSVDSNLILVGGPVVNKVTAALAEELGVPANYTGWKEKFGTGKDSGVVKFVEDVKAIGDHGVVLVAGTDREGTKAAAEALMEYLAGLH